MLAAIASRLNLKPRQSSLAERISKRFARDQKIYPQMITMRKVFVLPRRHGFMVAFSTLGVFAIALRIQNNMLLLIALALFILFLMSLVWSGRNLAGLSLSLQPDQRLVAGVTQNLSITIKNNQQFDRPRHLLAVKKGKTSQPIDFSLGVASIAIPVNIDRRGKMALPPILIESEFPFGLARCWSWVSAGEVLVAPRRDQAMPAVVMPANATAKTMTMKKPAGLIAWPIISPARHKPASIGNALPPLAGYWSKQGIKQAVIAW